MDTCLRDERRESAYFVADDSDIKAIIATALAESSHVDYTISIVIAPCCRRGAVREADDRPSHEHSTPVIAKNKKIADRPSAPDRPRYDIQVSISIIISP